jgi:uncharacterized protein GlcG (DUF336 family)
MSHVFSSNQISYAAASVMVAAAVKQANSAGIAAVITVIDKQGSVKAMANMDGAMHLAIAASKAKAYTALMGLGSGDLAAAMKEQLSELNSLTSFDNIVALGGGLPIFIGNELVGAIGVGGGSQDQDVLCAQTAVDAFV